ncbi:NAD(P)/FAD-dependent oxidoreductase [Paenibacillus sp. FJAT-27812]|uniref:NAD(P)/FAD-dependent oxidoreductase n=1 Tax=Paenibacillus sp. FJAT-27812 TaxID=1684143 RepID=UPI0006A7E081|nr:FAD-dependent oxidoreductase [Paenibacillus sp. FJAT-27812]
MTDYGMVIIGAGETGARAASELRSLGWTGNITLIGEEAHAPYERPPLSKQALQEAAEPSPAFILDHKKLEELRILWKKENKATSIDKGKHMIKLENGESIFYERLLLATGAKPRTLPTELFEPRPGSIIDTPLVHYLRSFSDALSLRKRLQPGKRIIVIGGGFIGLEVAASASACGCEVTVIEAGPRLLMRGVPEAIASIVEARHRSAGARIQLGVGISQVSSIGDEKIVTLANGEALVCDTIIAGIGAIPETTLAAESGLVIENGIRADNRLATSDPDIFAAGDCCSFPHPLYDGARIRLEAWRAAQDQGTFAAASMLGAKESYDAVPWFWSDQFELALQVTGLPSAGTVTVQRSLGSAGELFFHFTDEHRLIAASGIGSPGIAKEIRLAEKLIAARSILEPAQLARPDVKLKALLNA